MSTETFELGNTVHLDPGEGLYIDADGTISRRQQTAAIHIHPDLVNHFFNAWEGWAVRMDVAGRGNLVTIGTIVLPNEPEATR